MCTFYGCRSESRAWLEQPAAARCTRNAMLVISVFNAASVKHFEFYMVSWSASTRFHALRSTNEYGPTDGNVD